MKGRVFPAVLVYGVLANVPVWVASRLMGFSLGGLFNIEYLAVGIASLFVSRAVTVLLLVAVTAIDLVYNIGRTYMFHPGELLESSSSVLLYAGLHVGSIAAVVLAMAAVCILAARIGRAGKGNRAPLQTTCALAAMACIGLAIDCSRMKIAAMHSDFEDGGFRIARNSLHGIWLDETMLRHSQENIAGRQAAVVAGASRHLLELAAMDAGVAEGERPNIVFVVVESWGKPRSEDVDNGLIAPYMTPELERAYTVSTGTVPFSGPTVSGEMRELCGSSLGLAVMSAPAASLQGCLPERVEGMGYHTIAIHGFDGTMFERISWYRKIHFQEMWFQRQLLKEGLPGCGGPLAGICDAAIPGWIAGRLEQATGPQFVYWLTLNSHLPVPVNNMVKDPPSCSTTAALADDAICAWYQLVFNVHRSVAELAMKEEGRPTIFVVVGDHAPPFSAESRRGEFLHADVPYIILTPRCARCQPRQQLRSIASVLPPDRKSIPRPVDRSKQEIRAHKSGAGI